MADVLRKGRGDARVWRYAVFIGALAALPAVSPAAEPAGNSGVVDLSLLVSPRLPSIWPTGMTPYQLAPTRTIGPGPYNRDVVVIDEHTGTQFDAPAHFVPPPDSGLPGAGPMGKVTGDKVPVWRFVGEACVIDLRDHVDDAPAGESFLIMPEVVLDWEKKHRPLGPGDIVLFHSGYTDRYYQPFPDGQRFVSAVLDRAAPGWCAPAPETMKLLGERKVSGAGTDGASMGPVGPIAVATHQAGGQYGLVWTECATHLGDLPETGAFHAMLANKHAAGSGGETRAIAITEPKLAARLIKSAASKRVADLSVLLDEDLPITWPGEKPGLEGARYLAKTLNAFDPTRGPFFARMHILDSQAGTHLVTPSFALPPKDFDNQRYAPEVRAGASQVRIAIRQAWHQRRHGRKDAARAIDGPGPRDRRPRSGRGKNGGRAGQITANLAGAGEASRNQRRPDRRRRRRDLSHRLHAIAISRRFPTAIG